MKLITSLYNEKLWLVEKKGPDEIDLTKTVHGKSITLRLIRVSLRKYRLIFPSYLFSSKVSHLCPVDDEFRFCRNKGILFSILGTLRKSAIWGHIENKEFVMVNKYNSKCSKKELRNELKKRIDGEI